MKCALVEVVKLEMDRGDGQKLAEKHKNEKGSLRHGVHVHSLFEVEKSLGQVNGH